MDDSKSLDAKGKGELARCDAVGKSEGTDKKAVSRSSRRDFFKRAALGSIAVASTTSVAKMVASLATESDLQKAYLRDVLPGDRAISKREYVEMAEDEKKERIQMFTTNYKKQV